MTIKLLTMGHASAKIKKSDESDHGYLTAIMYLAPHTISGINVCLHASDGCSTGCLFSAGRGRFNNVIKARIKRTKFLFQQKQEARKQLIKEIEAFRNKCNRAGFKCAVRLNGLSDLPWENMMPELFTLFPDVMFYDYTKYVDRAISSVKGKNWPSNYHLTFSRSETNEDDCLKVLRAGGNVAVVFNSKNFPSKWKRFNVYNADKHDLRFLDNRGVQGLVAKGKAKKDTSGFVVKV